MKLPMNIAGRDLAGLWQGIGLRRPGQETGRPVDSAWSDLGRQVEIARNEWQAAQQYFQMVSDPELVDHAIYTLEAAQRKYMYLFKQLRARQGLPSELEG